MKHHRPRRLPPETDKVNDTRTAAAPPSWEAQVALDGMDRLMEIAGQTKDRAPSGQHPQVVISGLELLSQAGFSLEDEDDFSLDSYANDSFGMAETKLMRSPRREQKNSNDTLERFASYESNQWGHHERIINPTPRRRLSNDSDFACDSIKALVLPCSKADEEHIKQEPPNHDQQQTWNLIAKKIEGKAKNPKVAVPGRSFFINSGGVNRAA